MKLTSPTFHNNGTIPFKYTCDGENSNPPLEISDVPSNAKSLVLIMEDPDVPKHIRPDGMWDHWIIFNIPPNIKKIEENKSPQGTYGKNTFRKLTYGGPCPPDKEHRYFFKLYALDIKLNLLEGSSKQELINTMKSHIIEKTELIGRYNRI